MKKFYYFAASLLLYTGIGASAQGYTSLPFEKAEPSLKLPKLESVASDVAQPRFKAQSEGTDAPHLSQASPL